MANSVNNKIVCAKGLVIAQDIEGRVRAFDQKSGNLMWRYEPPVHAWKIILNGLSYDVETGIVFVGNGKRMAALDAATGKVIWKDAGWGDRGEACADTPGIGDGCIVSSGNWEGMFCNDVKSGKLLWSVIDRTRRFPGATPLIKEGRIHTLAAASYLEIDLKTGKTVRQKKLPSGVQVTTRVLITDSHLIFGTVKAGLLALDRNTLEVAWKGSVGAALAPFAAYSKRPQRCVGTIPVLMPDGTVCASSNDGAIHFWRESDGRHLKEFRTNAPYFADVALADGRIFAADSEGCIRAFDVV
jgi:outer membrane protein assembly factor BamB